MRLLAGGGFNGGAKLVLAQAFAAVGAKIDRAVSCLRSHGSSDFLRRAARGVPSWRIVRGLITGGDVLLDGRAVISGSVTAMIMHAPPIRIYTV